MFLSLFVNSLVILIFVNARITVFNMSGLYSDLESIWTEKVGTVIGFTMIINIFSIPAANLVVMLIKNI